MRSGTIALATFLAIIGVGLGLGATPWGVFGTNALFDTYHAKANQELLEHTVKIGRAHV